MRNRQTACQMVAERGAQGGPLDERVFACIAESYAKFVGHTLVPDGAGPDWLYHEAPFAVLAHDGGDDPRFIYANRCAQARFEYDWAEIVGLASRLSAEPQEREARELMLQAVSRDGFLAGYRGIRISKSGRRFWIQDGVIWQLVDERGVACGQAAMFARWRDV